MSVVIRTATSADAQFLPAIEISAAQAFRLIDGLSWLADSAPMAIERHHQLISLSTCWIAVDRQDRPQGFLSAERQASDLHIHELSVCHSVQGKGLGRGLIEVAKDYARSNGLRFITLTTFRDVPWNAPFYSRLGFETNIPSEVDPQLEAMLREEYKQGFAPGTRCAMIWRVT